MAERRGPVYEVTHVVDRDIVARFDAWLAQHLHEMLCIPGISSASSYIADDHADGRPQRVAQYHFDGEEDLEHYLAGPAASMRKSATAQFDDQFEVSRRILRQSDAIDDRLQAQEQCLNCDTTLAGQYCGECGQRASSRLISIWELLRDAFGDMLELDSRVWRTLIPLISKPGKLTSDYLKGRRARFMPPFRTYLVLSIVFFLVAFFDPTENFGIIVDTGTETPLATEDSNAAGAGGTDDVAQESGDDGIDPGDEETDPTAVCAEIAAEDWPEWLSEERVKIACERATADDGQAFASKLLDSIPAALIGLLPVMALILKTLYPLSKRYYVEHLLFVVHFHAFVFLILSILAVFSLFISLFGAQDYVTPVATVAVALYIPIYLFKAMRLVYTQGWFATSLKFVVLILSYMVGLLVILAMTAAIAAFSI